MEKQENPSLTSQIFSLKIMKLIGDLILPRDLRTTCRNSYNSSISYSFYRTNLTSKTHQNNKFRKL